MALSFEVLRNSDFRRLMITRMFGVFALQAQAVIVGWQIYSLTRDPLMLGLVGLAEAIPAIIFALFAGHVVDKSRPHTVFRNCLLVHAAISALLLLLAGGYAGASERSIIVTLFACVFLSGLTRSFVMPASFTMLSRIVPKHQISGATAWLASGFHFSAVGGPAVAGLVYGGYGEAVVWWLPLTCMVLAVLVISGMSRSCREFKNHDSREPALKSMTAGWKFVRNNPVLLPVMVLDMFAVLFGGTLAVLPVFADQVLHTGSEGLGLLRAAPAFGSIIIALYFAMRPMKEIRGSVLLQAITGFAACMMAFGLSTSFAGAFFFLLVGGAFDSVSMVIRGTLMQLLIPDAMRGRVSALNSMFIISSNEIGAFESGVAARLLGLVPSIVAGGAMSALVVGVVAAACPALRGLVVRVEKSG